MCSLLGWLYRSEKKYYTLSVRSLLELENYLEANFPEELEDAKCVVCQDLVFTVRRHHIVTSLTLAFDILRNVQGWACSTPQCNCRMHTFCQIQHSRSSASCPSCRQYVLLTFHPTRLGLIWRYKGFGVGRMVPLPLAKMRWPRPMRNRLKKVHRQRLRGENLVQRFVSGRLDGIVVMRRARFTQSRKGMNWMIDLLPSHIANAPNLPP